MSGNGDDGRRRRAIERMKIHLLTPLTKCGLHQRDGRRSDVGIGWKIELFGDFMLSPGFIADAYRLTAVRVRAGQELHRAIPVEEIVLEAHHPRYVAVL